MSSDFNVNHISYRFFGDKLTSLDLSNNLIIEASDNNIELKTTNKTISFNNNTIFNYGLALKNIDLSNIINITGKILNIDTLFVTDIANSQANIDDYGYINNGYIRATTIGYNPAITNSIIGSSIAYFTYIDVSGGDSSFNNSVYIKNSLDVSGATTISNDLIVNGTSYVTLYNAISSYIINIKEELSSNKILTLDLSATNISVSNELVVNKTSFLNNISISGHLLDSVLKVPHDFTIDPSGHDNASGTLIINGDLIVYGNKTTINSNIVEISDITLSVATNLMNANDLYNNQAGLDISNVASIKYDGTNWNFNGGQLTVENKKVSLDVSLIALKTSTDTSLNSLNSYFDLSYIQLVNNNDNSYNATYSRTQIDASFISKSDFEVSYNSFITYLDNSYVKTTTFDVSFSSLKTYLDASYILKSMPMPIQGPYSRIGQIIQGESSNNYSGFSVSINDEGNIIAIGTVNLNYNGSYAGSVRVYRYNDISWIQISQTIDGEAPGDRFGFSLSLNGSGNILAIGAIYNDGNGSNSGHVRVYRYVNDSSWIQISQDIDGKSVGGYFGNSVSLNSIGNILAVGAPYNVVNGIESGQVRVYQYINDSSWTPLGGDINSNQPYTRFGESVSLNSDGTILAIGIPSANAISGYSGAKGQARVYRYNSVDISWIQISQDINGDEQYHNAGYSVSLNSSGSMIAIGYPAYNYSTNNSGLVRVFRYVNDTSWTQVGIDIFGELSTSPESIRGDELGLSVSLNSSGNILAIGAPNNDTNGIDAGVIRVYKYNDVSWVRLDISLNIQDMSVYGYLGSAVAINALGNRVIAGAPYINNGYCIVYDYKLFSTLDNTLNFLRDKLDLSYVLKSTFESSYNSLKEQIEISFGSIRLTSLDTSSISVETINTKHSSQRFNNILWNQIGLDISNGPPLINNNKKVAMSNDGKVVALSSSSHSDVSKGRVYVYELSYNQASYNWRQLGLSSEIIIGVSNDDQFGWDIALSSNGRVVAASSINSDASGINCGQVRLFELSNNNVWRQKGLNINGPRTASESGYSISLAGNGNSIAIGAWKDNSNGTNAGAVRVYDFSSNIADWRQKGQTIAGVSGSFEGYATALSLDGQTLASVSIVPGLLSISGGYIIHSFTNVGTSTFRPSFSGSVEVLIVGGGGGGGPILGGGGGGGGVIWLPSVNVSADTSYSIVVGDGGPSGTDGENSTAFGAIAAGGGTSARYDSGIGTAGGSGGGAAANNSLLNKGGGTSGNSLGSNSGFIYGCSGGNMLFARIDNAGPTRAAGGGGAGGPGLDTNSNVEGETGQTGMGSGGVGIANAILGPSYYWAGGGGGGGYVSQTGGWGGLGGGGGGSANGGGGTGGGSALDSGKNGTSGNATGGAGGTNTGGGGGGGSWNSGQGGKGGSGIVVIRYFASNITRGLVKTFTISGTTWTPKGTINGSDISFGRAIKLSATGNAIVIGAPGYNIPPVTNSTSSSSFAISATSLTRDQHITTAASVPGRTLGSILNVSEKETVRLIMQANTSDVYIGARRRATSTNATGRTSLDWEWVSGDTWEYQNFQAGDPNNLSHTALIMWGWTGAGDWYNASGTANMRAIYKTTTTTTTTITNSIPNVGQAYVYGYQGGTTWTQLGQAIQGISGGDEFGSSVSISNDGTIIAIGSDNNNSNRGQVRVFSYANNYWNQVSNAIDGKTASSRAGIHALSGDGTTLIQSNNTYNSVYGINKTLAVYAPMTSISGNLLVMGNISVNSLDISTNHSYTTNGYSYKMFGSDLSNAIMKEYYSDVISTRHLKVQITGNGYITNRNNSYRALSDSRLKENIQDSGPKLEDLLKVRVVDYTMKGSNNTKYIGVLAQELEDVFPNLVTELEPSPKDIQDGNTIKYKAVNYSSFDALLIKSLQEQNAMLKNIEKRIIALEDELDDN